MAVVTAPRSGLGQRMLAAFQLSRGNPVTDFSNSAHLWSEAAQADPSPDKGPSGPYMTQIDAEGVVSRFNTKSKSPGMLRAQATYQVLSTVFSNHWGGGPPAFSLVSQLTDGMWLSLAWIDNRFANPSSAYFVTRQWNCWFHKVILRINPRGKFLVEANYAAEFVDDPVPLTALAGLVLPPPNMDATDIDPFTGYSTSFIYDTAGANIVVPFESLEIEFNQRIVQDWDQCQQQFAVVKGGKAKCFVRFKCKVGSEAWQVMNDSRGNMKKALLFSAATAGGHAFSITVPQIDFDTKDDVDLLGHDGAIAGMAEFVGQAFKDDTTGNFIIFSLT